MTHYLPLDIVIHIHEKLIEEYGGKKGILDLGLLKSALEMPKASFNGKILHRTIFDKAAAYLFHISKNHPFVDGNKRTSGMACILFLTTNDVCFSIFEKEYEELILATVQNRISKKEIAKFFRQASKTISSTKKSNKI